MTPQQPEIEVPDNIRVLIFDENRRRYYSGRKIETWSQGAEWMYRHLAPEIQRLQQIYDLVKKWDKDGWLTEKQYPVLRDMGFPLEHGAKQIKKED